MKRIQPDQVHIDLGERLLTILEEALRRSGRLLPVTTGQINSAQSRKSQPDINTEHKPDWFDDPYAVIERGRQLIKQPPVLVSNSIALSNATNALALAARNGKPISQEIRRIMDADRRKSECT